MQPQGAPTCGAENSANPAELTEHERAQEKLFILWRSGRVQAEHVAVWAASLARLQEEGSCEYLCWLFKRSPGLTA